MNEENCVNFISVVVPVYNEEACLEELIARCVESCENTGKKFEIILVDDGSSDRSTAIMATAVKKHSDAVVSCILNRNYGQHNAIMAGFSLVRGDLIITIDADLQNPPEEIPNLVSAAEAGNDVVGTVRQQRRDTLFRRFASKIINKITQQATGVHMKDYGCMLRAYRRNIVDAMLQCNERSTFIPVLANGFARNSCEIPVAHNERVAGNSKYSVWKLINLQFNLLTCMTTFPLRMLSLIGLLVSVTGILLGALIIVMRFAYGAAWAADGVFTLFAVLFFIAGFQLIGMGLLGEYIGRIYYDVRARPRYFIETINGRRPESKNREK